MTTLASQADLAPTWKQEVNRRLAAHRNRKGASTEPAAPLETEGCANSRAAEAAARVAARYAKAPSYSEMLAAEAAPRAALKTQTAAPSVLDGLEAIAGGESEREPERSGAGVGGRAWEPTVESVRPGAASSSQPLDTQTFAIRWDEDFPVRATEPSATRATHGPGSSEIPFEDRRQPAALEQDALGAEGIEVVEGAHPIHANLIAFPRELVAARKVRPRLAEGPHAAAWEPERQLSIFEVDPGSISTQPAAAEALAEPPGHEWSGIELDAQPLEEPDLKAARAAAALQLAPMNLRLMAALVDGALIAGAFLGSSLVAAANAKDLPPMREIEVGAAVAVTAIAVLYQVFFFTLAAATPGMKYAHLSLRTFGGEKPTRAQRWGRLGALLLSLLPMGLGVAWAIFDEEHLSWHDRLSGTYPRRC